jgi:AAA-like domain/TIR domain/Caspase domain
VISLPVVRIVQERLLPESRQVHVAEVFLGGLLRPLVEITAGVDADGVQYEFLDGVRDGLLESMRTSETVSVLNEVSMFVAERLGVSIDEFMAVLRSPQQFENQELVGNARPFALVTAQVLRQLGSEYMPFAEELEEHFRQEDLYSLSQTELLNSDHISAKRVALLIGISEYGEGLPTLLTPPNDILAMQRVLQNPDVGGFDEVEILANPNLFQINDAIGKLFSEQRNPDDLILFYFSGHGLKYDNGEFHFALPGFVQGRLIQGTTLPASALHRYINQSASKRQILILDCDFSGAVGEYVPKNNTASVIETNTEEAVGHILMTSTNSGHYRLEDASSQLSRYTKHLVEGLETGAANVDSDLKITVDELHEYVKRKIASEYPGAILPKLFVLKDRGYQLRIANNPTASPMDIKEQLEVPKVFISYRNQDPDRAIARAFQSGIQAAGFSAFMEGESVRLGEDWAQRIDRELKSCDYFLLLLSEKSAVSDMVMEEVRRAKQLRDQRGKPWLFPIRVNFPFHSPLDYDLRDYLQQIQQREWNSDEDTAEILTEILSLMSKGQKLNAVAQQESVEMPPVAEPELPGGQVGLASQFYVERGLIETRCYEAIIRPGALIRIKAPHQMGKTSLLSRILRHAEGEDCVGVSLNFQLADSAVFEDLDKFLRWFSASVGHQLKLANKLSDYWDEAFGSKGSCSIYFEKYILPSLNQPLVLCLDEVDIIFQHEKIAADFVGLLRAWHEKSKSNRSWEKLRLVLVNLIEVPIPTNQSPFNVGLPIELGEFTAIHVQDLANRYGLRWQTSEVKQLMAMVGGHPYLVHLALYHIASGNVSLAGLLRDASTESGLYTDHLQQYLRTLEKHPSLMEAVRRLVKSDVPVRLESGEAFQLYRMGLVDLSRGNIAFRNELYRVYFRSQFF